MNAQTPRIAIPEPTSTDAAYNQRSLPQYLRAVEAAGGIPVPIPLRESREAQARMLASCSGVLLPGSPADVDPARYGQAPIKECAARDSLREAADEFLLKDAFATGKPLLGICYGLQFLNVWRHGTLIQDLPHPEQDNGNHVNHEPGREVEKAHAVVLREDSRLSLVLSQLPQEEGDLSVNSSHHQAVDRPGEGLAVVATSPVDGVIEAVEGTEATQFVLAVQWHPERSYDSSAASRTLFKVFLEAARAWTPFCGPSIVEIIEAEFFRAGLAALPPAAYRQFESYLDLLLRWNQRLNLTAINDPLQVIQRHFVESAFTAQHLPTGIKSLLDFGSGAGFPGIPIAICRPEIQVTLAEAQGRKASFLQETLRIASIPGRVYAGRVETMPEQHLFDVVAMRAVEKMESAVPMGLKRAKRYLVLLTTEKSMSAAPGLRDLSWLDPIPLPNSSQMILAIGRRTEDR